MFLCVCVCDNYATRGVIYSKLLLRIATETGIPERHKERKSSTNYRKLI